MSVDVTDAARLLPRRGYGSAARLRAAGNRLLGATERAAALLSVVIVDDREMRRLNRSYRGRDKTTDVLSFSQLEGVAIKGAGDQHLGDVVLSLPVARRQAKAGGGQSRKSCCDFSFMACSTCSATTTRRALARH